METWILVLILGNLTFVAVMAWLALHFQAKRAQRLSDERLRILERFNSAEELNAFLSSEPGEKLFERFSAPRADPRRLIAGLTALAVVMLFMGAAFFFLTQQFDDGAGFLVPTALVSFGAVGLLAACGISFVLVQRWSLVPRMPACCEPGTREANGGEGY